MAGCQLDQTLRLNIGEVAMQTTALKSPLARAAPVPCCLIVEDQALIGMALEAYLEEFGYQVAGPLTSNASALAWLESNTPDLAILDYVLSDGSCLELVRELRRRRVPFLIYSGHSRKAETPEEFQNVPWLEKPAARAQLLQEIESMPIRVPFRL
ncbi:MAG: response regulator [Microvirga sp.]